MSDDELRKLAGFVVDNFIARLAVGSGPGVTDLLLDAAEAEMTEEEKEAAETGAALLEWVRKYEEPDG